MADHEIYKTPLTTYYSEYEKTQYKCVICEYVTTNRKDYKKHENSIKHKKKLTFVSMNNALIQSVDNTPEIDPTIAYNDMGKSLKQLTNSSDSDNVRVCICGLAFNGRTSLWRHKQKCVVHKVLSTPNNGGGAGTNSNNPNNPNNPNNQTNITFSCNELLATMIRNENREKQEIKKVLDCVVEKMKQNTEMLLTTSMQFEELKREVPVIINSNTNNTTNAQFNINVFLNEQCKDAINLSDFINSIKISLDDLTFTKNNGLIEGIANVFMKELGELDIYKRPIHCTDKKRTVMYVKDDHIWQRDEGLLRIRNAIFSVANMEFKAIKLWMDANPGWEHVQRLRDVLEKLTFETTKDIENDVMAQQKIFNNIKALVSI